MNGTKLMVVGHQQHATEDEIQEYRNNPDSYKYEKNCDELMTALVNGKCMDWDSRDRKSWLQFGRILSGNLSFELGTPESANLLDSISFCNFIQIPDFNLLDRQGKDKEEYYLQALTIFKEYLEEARPKKVIVWGNYSYPYIASLGKEVDKDRCILTLLSGEKVDVLRIPHPCRLPKGGYNYIIPVVSRFDSSGLNVPPKTGTNVPPVAE